jgi:hypothetical protein
MILRHIRRVIFAAELLRRTRFFCYVPLWIFAKIESWVLIQRKTSLRCFMSKNWEAEVGLGEVELTPGNLETLFLGRSRR